jgi:hypothetical protein
MRGTNIEVPRQVLVEKLDTFGQARPSRNWFAAVLLALRSISPSSQHVIAISNMCNDVLACSVM